MRFNLFHFRMYGFFDARFYDFLRFLLIILFNLRVFYFDICVNFLIEICIYIRICVCIRIWIYYTIDFELIQLIQNVLNLRFITKICQIQCVHQVFCFIVNCVVYARDYFNRIRYFSTSNRWFIRFSFLNRCFCIFLCNVR